MLTPNGADHRYGDVQQHVDQIARAVMPAAMAACSKLRRSTFRWRVAATLVQASVVAVGLWIRSDVGRLSDKLDNLDRRVSKLDGVPR